MRKRNLFCAAYLAMGAAMAFTSCSNDDDVLNGGNIANNAAESVQTINLSVASAGDNFLTTRATRPLYSSAAAQNINIVKVVIYKKPQSSQYGEDLRLVAVKTFTPWMNGAISSVYENDGHGRQASWSLSGDDLIKEEGDYIAYAIGYNTDDYSDLSSFDGKKVSEGSEGKLTTPFTVSASGNAKVEEIFAGSAEFEVTEQEAVASEGEKTYHFNANLTLHRQVAGSFGYFTNIPTKGNADHSDKTGTKLRLVASAANKNLAFCAFNSDFRGGNSSTPNTSSTTTTTTNVKYVVNGYEGLPAETGVKFYGSSSDDAFKVYEINLSDWFEGSEGNLDINNDGLLNKNDNWKNFYNNPLAELIKR